MQTATYDDRRTPRTRNGTNATLTNEREAGKRGRPSGCTHSPLKRSPACPTLPGREFPMGVGPQTGLVAELPPKLRPFFNERTELCAVNWGRLRSLRACPNRVCPQWPQSASVFP